MGRRRVIHLPGVEHNAPIPAAVRLGDLLFSSAINGKDPASGKYPEEAREQVKFAFENMAALVRAGGGDVGDIAHVTVFLRNRDDRKHVDEEWLRMFPDPEDRPARHAVALDRPGAAVVQLEIVAVLGP
jgi:2-iminobutanoate/2-iminopropanoate deaminase